MEGLGGTRSISKPKLWISSYKIPKVKKGEDAVGSMSPPSSPDSEKENASPLERVSILHKSRNNNEEDASDKNGYQRPNADFLRLSVEPQSLGDDTKRAKKRVRWRDPLVRVIRIGRVSRERQRPSKPVGRSSLHEHREKSRRSKPLSLHYAGLGVKAGPGLREYCRQSQSEVVTNSRNKIHQTWACLLADLCTFQDHVQLHACWKF